MFMFPDFKVLESPKYAYTTSTDPSIRAYAPYPVSSPLISATPLSDSKVTPPPPQQSPETDPSPKIADDQRIASIKSEISMNSVGETYAHHRYSTDKNETVTYEHQPEPSYGANTGRQSVTDSYANERVKYIFIITIEQFNFMIMSIR